MKGIVFNLLEQVVVQHHGDAVWEKLLDTAELSGSYTSLGSYPDSEILGLVTAASWEDASLGCPEPGVAYAQVVTAGWVIRLRHGGREYQYHADAERAVPCPTISAD